ncbi:alpha/beta hydrolase family protein [Ramlibacter sp.]|uniref:alpha/beta hydrolase family protein n=1 Tax=Ramlibacter sp. TaxID=1917967 RepID=UPI003D0F50FE
MAASARAGMGMMELPANDVSGVVTVFYPTGSLPAAVRRSEFSLDVALNAPPTAARSRLVVISHGSPGSPWVHFELAHSLVDAGFTVAFPEHHADNASDPSEPGPPAWRRRPVEVSRAIDRLSREAAFTSRIDFARVGMFGMSAGGHTALTLAGGRWSPSRLRDHCRANLEADFHACAGPSVALTGGVLDAAKKAVVRAINDRKFDDPASYGHVDARIVAIAAGVPFAADFDPASLREPRVALAIIPASQDRWLVPRFHSDAIMAACRSCERIAEAESGGHGALLAPLPPGGERLKLIADPPGFDRAVQVPRINAGIVRFFLKALAAM